MGLFTRNEEAKARRTQEREEQQKKEKAVPPPYVHTPTHALSDSLLSVPHAYKGTDKQRLKKAHQQRLEKEASALAAGSDTNVTKIPAKYWQGQPLPAQFKAPTPASLHELAISKPSLRGKKIKLPAAATAQRQSQPPIDEGKSNLGTRALHTANLSRGPAKSANGSSHKPETKQFQQDPAAEEGREAELKRLRRRVRELEEKQGAQDELISNTLVGAAPVSAPRSNVSTNAGFGSRISSSDALSGQSSGWSKKVDSLTPPTSPSTSRDDDGVIRYDWAFHWARVNARTEEERSRLPPAINPRQGPAPPPKTLICYTPPNLSRKIDSPRSATPSSSPPGPSRGSSPARRRNSSTAGQVRSARAKPRAAFVEPGSTDDMREAMQRLSYNDMVSWGFSPAAAARPSTLRPNGYPSRRKSRVNKAEARRSGRFDGNYSQDETPIPLTRTGPLHYHSVQSRR